jgi:hypothetical protein
MDPKKYGSHPEKNRVDATLYFQPIKKMVLQNPKKISGRSDRLEIRV